MDGNGTAVMRSGYGYGHQAFSVTVSYITQSRVNGENASHVEQSYLYSPTSRTPLGDASIILPMHQNP